MWLPVTICNHEFPVPYSIISQDVASFDVDLLEQRDGMFGIVLADGTGHKGKRIAQAVNKRMNLGIPTTPGYADVFPFAKANIDGLQEPYCSESPLHGALLLRIHSIPLTILRLLYFAGLPRFPYFGCAGGSISFIYPTAYR